MDKAREANPTQQFATMVDLLTQFVKKVDALAPTPQAQGGSRIPFRAATPDQRSEELVCPTRPSLPKTSMPMFLQEAENSNEGLDVYFTQYQGKSAKFKQIVTFESFFNIMGEKIGKGNDYQDKKHLQKMQIPMFDGNNPTPRAWLEKKKQLTSPFAL